MSDILASILAHKLLENQQRGSCPLARQRPPLSVPPFLQRDPFIAEIKRASPSKGSLNEGVDVLAQARAYQHYGAGMISVLTDQHYFHGSFETLAKVATIAEVPLLCKDFIIDESQIDWAYHAGADAILLLVAALKPEALQRLYNYALSLDLQVLVEIHHPDELDKALSLQPTMLGVNSRDLKRMCIDKEQAIQLLEQLPSSIEIRVAESGIDSANDISRFSAAGANTFLIGSYFMCSSNLEQSFAELKIGLNSSKPSVSE